MKRTTLILLFALCACTPSGRSAVPDAHVDASEDVNEEESASDVLLDVDEDADEDVEEDEETDVSEEVEEWSLEWRCTCDPDGGDPSLLPVIIGCDFVGLSTGEVVESMQETCAFHFGFSCVCFDCESEAIDEDDCSGYVMP